MAGIGSAMLRQPLLAAARSQRLRRTAEHSRLVRPVLQRYVAGPQESDALRVSSELVGSGMRVTLDYLGENADSREDATRTVNAYRSVLKALGENGLAGDVEVSVKLSAIGLCLSPQGDSRQGDSIALEGATAIAEAAAQAGTSMTVDMEDHTTTDQTLAVVSSLRTQYPSVGVVIQAYLHRSEADCRLLATSGSRVRLCKGAYAEPESVAYQGPDVEQSYRLCLQILFDGDGYPMVATHDPAMLAAADDLVRERSRPADSFEYQMLLGVRPQAQQSLVSDGQRLRVYVPYGSQWYGYFMRRLAERPANVGLFLRSLSSKK